jgi:hypothetical protein
VFITAGADHQCDASWTFGGRSYAYAQGGPEEQYEPYHSCITISLHPAEASPLNDESSHDVVFAIAKWWTKRWDHAQALVVKIRHLGPLQIKVFLCH